MLRTVAGLLLLGLCRRLGTEFVARPTGIVEVAPEVLATEKFWVDAWETIGAVIGGVLIGAVAGVILGLAMGRIQLVRWFFTTYVSALYTLPMVAVVPLMTIWLGYTSETRLVAVALSAFLPIVVTTADGSRSIPKEYLDVARTFRAKMHNIWFGIALRNTPVPDRRPAARDRPRWSPPWPSSSSPACPGWATRSSSRRAASSRTRPSSA